jgi:cytochrome c553
MRVALVFAAALALAPFASQAQGDTAGRDLAAACAMCHGTNGHSKDEPLAGMRKDELVRKVSSFRSGDKPATVMHQIAKGYTDREIQLIAEYFSAQKR